MSELPEYADNLYYVWGRHGILVIDALSHTEAGESYTAHFNCPRSDVQHVMLVPEPEQWGTRWQEPEPFPHDCIEDADWNQGDDYVRCVCNTIIPTLPTTVVDPDDPRLAGIDVEAEAAAVLARADQLQARWQERELLEQMAELPTRSTEERFPPHGDR